jgi:HEAT repeat protein
MIQSKFITPVMLSLMVFCSFGLQNVSAQKKEAKTYTVRYSYEKQTRTGQKRYMLIPVPTKIDGSVYTQFKDRQRALFKEVKQAKSKTYGKTKFNADETKKEVSIFIDPKQSKFSKLIMAETIYTFTENGAMGIRFPKSEYSGRVYTRLDVPYASYQLTLPYWEGLPPKSLQGVLLSFPDGSLVTSSVLKEQVIQSDTHLVSFLNQTLKLGEVSGIQAVVEATETSTIKGLEEGFIPLLKSASKELRLLALRGLKGRDQKKVNQEIRTVMDEDPEEMVREQASRHLALSKESQFSEIALFYLLQSKKSKVVIEGIKGLRKAKSQEVTPKFISMLNHKDNDVRLALIQTLIDRKAQKELLKAMNGELTVEVKVEIAQALVLSKKYKNDAFKFLVTQPQATPAIQATELLGKDKKNKQALSLLSKALSHPDLEVVQATSKALVVFGGLKALTVLNKGDTSDPKRALAIHKGMRLIFKTQSSKSVFKTVGRSKSAFERSAAIGVLGFIYTENKKNQKTVMKLLNKSIVDSNDQIRAETVRSLGEIQSDETQKMILTLTKDPSAQVRTQLAYSIRFFGKDVAKPFLNECLKAKELPVIKEAIISIGHLKIGEMASNLIQGDTYIKNDQVEIRRETATTIGVLADVLLKGNQGKLETKTKKMVFKITELLEEAIDKDQDQGVRIRSIEGLGWIPSDNANFKLSARAQAGSQKERIAVINAAIRHGNDGAIDILAQSMGNDKDAFVRRKAYEAIKHFKKMKDLSRLKEILDRQLKIEKDPELKDLLQKQRKSL